jgi:Tol biopolymer transport system component
LPVRTLVTVAGEIDAFAQDGRRLAWIATPVGYKGCGTLVLHEIPTAARTSVRTGECNLGFDGLLLVGRRAYWTAAGGSNTTFYLELSTASAFERRPREVAFQSIGVGGFDHLISPVSDGKSVYFWTSPEDSTPGPIERFDGIRRRPVTPTISSIHALAAGGGRFAFAEAVRTYDCAAEPAWSPDGRVIAFAAGPNDTDSDSARCREGLWLVNPDGSMPRRIALDAQTPDWSPDGSRLVYGDSAGTIVVSDAGGGSPRTIIGRGSEPSWSPDGRRLAFARDTSVFVSNADGTGERLVVADAREPDWSPDGTRLVVARTSRTTPGLALVNVEGDPQLFTLTRGYDTEPAWSPDGRRLAFAHCWDPHLACATSTDATKISFIAPDGSNRTDPQADSDETFDAAPSWAPDSKQLVYTRMRYWEDDGDSHLHTLTRQLTSTPNPQTPVVVRSRTGRTLSRVDPDSPAAGLVVTNRFVGVLTRERGTSTFEIGGAVDRHVTTAGAVNSELAASGNQLVFRIGRVIFVLDARRGRPRVVARAASTPVGLSIVGRRIAWAEKLGRTARVRAVVLPAP